MRNILTTLSLLFILTACAQSGTSADIPESYDYLVGTYGKHIYQYHYDCARGTADATSVLDAEDPTFLTLDNEQDHFYAVGEGVWSFKKTDSSWTQTGFAPKGGSDACHICINPDNDLLFTAEYGGGSLSIYSLKDKVLTGIHNTLSYQSEYNGNGPFQGRQDKSYMHQSRILPLEICKELGIEGTWLLACDLGNDLIRVGQIVKDSESIFNEAFDIPCGPGAGPRHIEFNPMTHTLYCITELSDEVIVWQILSEDGRPAFKELERHTANPTAAHGGADIHLSQDGKFLYASLRLQNDGIAAYSVKEDGTLEEAGYFNTGKHPRNFAISPDGSRVFVACKDSHSIEVYNRDSLSGALTGPESTQTFPEDDPVCILFLTK